MRALGITDGSAGMNAQVRALATAMKCELDLQAVQVKFPWKYLPNKAYDLGLRYLFPVTSFKPKETPDIIISCGRKGALISASLKAKTKRIHIQDPQMNPLHFDVVIVMEHDKIRGSNILQTPYALHDITRDKMQTARTHWEPKFAHLPRPWNAILIGGSTNKYTFTPAAMQALIKEMGAIPGSLLITTSRRTGEENIATLTHHFGGHAGRAFLYTGELENPYPGMLACADTIYVTNDSVNMMSEAVASGKPVEILKLKDHENTKPARFAERLKTINVSPHEMMTSLVHDVKLMLA